MKNTIKVSLLASAVFALASVGAYAQNATSVNITLTATIGSFDNITCTQTALDLNGGTTITTSGLTPGQLVNCFVTTNDTAAQDVTAYLPIADPLTGTIAANTIPNTAIEWSTAAASGFAHFAPLTAAGLTADDGAIVASGVTVGDSTPVNFYLALDVPAGQRADTYSAILTVAITPSV